jgi:hypothetical protein
MKINQGIWVRELAASAHLPLTCYYTVSVACRAAPVPLASDPNWAQAWPSRHRITDYSSVPERLARRFECNVGTNVTPTSLPFGRAYTRTFETHGTAPPRRPNEGYSPWQSGSPLRNFRSYSKDTTQTIKQTIPGCCTIRYVVFAWVRVCVKSFH